jgi:hypothetical protein
MIGGKAHANHVIDISRQIVTDIDIIETANIDAINAWDIIPDILQKQFLAIAVGLELTDPAPLPKMN